MNSSTHQLRTMPADVAQRIQAADRVISPETVAAAQKIYEPLQEKPPYAGVKVTRDIYYGPAERNRLDIFEPEAERSLRPVLAFVHGGGFVGGDKRLEDSPFYDNIGVWAVRNGLIGVTLTHRLAPDSPWPAAVEDIGRAIEWLKHNVRAHQGDSERIFLMGQSAGAAHAATYAGHSRFHPAGGVGVVGAILLSGIYNVSSCELLPNFTAYYGDDRSLYAERSALPAILNSKVPLFIVVAELEPALFHRQGIELLAAVCERDGTCPRLLSLPGHNHLTEVFHINSGEDLLGSQILEFIRIGR